jgi:hypothetical protein
MRKKKNSEVTQDLMGLTEEQMTAKSKCEGN